MIKPVFSIILFLFAFLAKAQLNIVPNGSFETYNTCPLGIADFSVSNWYSPTWGSCDYFNACNGTDTGIPNNYLGHQHAQEGNAYAGFGIIFDSLSNSTSREYIQVELLDELASNKIYHFSCYINKSDSSSVCLSEIGVALSNNPIGGQYLHNIPYIPQCTTTSSLYLCDTVDWIKVEFFFYSNGGEKFLTIGCFKDDSDINMTVIQHSNQGLFAYYYLDNVALVEMIDINIPNVITPNGDGINDFIDFTIFPYEIKIYNRWGKEVYSNKSNEYWFGKDNGGNKLTEGVYFYVVENNKAGFIHLVR